MKYPLTICYMTNRKDCRFKWFFDSLEREVSAMPNPVFPSVVIVSCHKDTSSEFTYGVRLTVTKPKPCVWQGEHRLTKEDYFAASNARNTAICYAPDGWIAFVDDLSVLMPGWIKCVQEAMEKNYIACGAYKKVKKLVVENGAAKSWEEFPSGIDSRWDVGSDSGPVKVDGGRMYGCSIAAPVEAFLQINGFPEMADGLGSEDYLAGLALENNGWEIMYDRRMLTLESEELHHQGDAFRRSDFGVSPNDKSHAALEIARKSKTFPQHYDLRELRKTVLNGGEFPENLNPLHEWFTGIPLKDL